jgi:hypothetical protein
MQRSPIQSRQQYQTYQNPQTEQRQIAHTPFRGSTAIRGRFGRGGRFIQGNQNRTGRSGAESYYQHEEQIADRNETYQNQMVNEYYQDNNGRVSYLRTPQEGGALNPTGARNNCTPQEGGAHYPRGTSKAQCALQNQNQTYYQETNEEDNEEMMFDNDEDFGDY